MKQAFSSLYKWFSNSNEYDSKAVYRDKIDWIRALPFILLNLSCLLVFFVGYSAVAVITALVLWVVRVFFIGAFYHRYFSHRTYKANRFWQFIFAIMGASAAQRGALWWATHHRHHHVASDQPEDAHSPVQHGFLWSHVGWFLSEKNYYYNPERVADLTKFPELVFLDKFDGLVPMLLALCLYIAGSLLHHFMPSLGTSGFQMLVWGFSISTIVLFNTTVTINSISHIYGKRRFETKDNSHNSFLLALLTLGEGWHNNHHHYPSAARQGFMWWEVDITYYILKLMEKLHIISDVRNVPKAILGKNLAVKKENSDNATECA
ncbi:MAG: acyl-CoA desaturase [Gammaproteobacteria bacterium]|nr:acyl-CoA desaturase [Gammaproteobacteria bacterium]